MSNQWIRAAIVYQRLTCIEYLTRHEIHSSMINYNNITTIDYDQCCYLWEYVVTNQSLDYIKGINQLQLRNSAMMYVTPGCTVNQL